jgi:hypothetical protein
METLGLFATIKSMESKLSQQMEDNYLIQHLRGYKGSIVAEADDDGELVVQVKLLKRNFNHHRDCQSSTDEFFEVKYILKHAKNVALLRKISRSNKSTGNCELFKNKNLT